MLLFLTKLNKTFFFFFFLTDPVHAFSCIELDVFSFYSSSSGTAHGNLRNTFWTSVWCRPTKKSKAHLVTHGDHSCGASVWGWDSRPAQLEWSEWLHSLLIRANTRASGWLGYSYNTNVTQSVSTWSNLHLFAHAVILSFWKQLHAEICLDRLIKTKYGPAENKSGWLCSRLCRTHLVLHFDEIWTNSYGYSAFS